MELIYLSWNIQQNTVTNPIASHCFIKPTKHEKKKKENPQKLNLLFSVGIVSRLPAYLEVFCGSYSYAFGPIANMLWGQRVLRTPFSLRALGFA